MSKRLLLLAAALVDPVAPRTAYLGLSATR